MKLYESDAIGLITVAVLASVCSLGKNSGYKKAIMENKARQNEAIFTTGTNEYVSTERNAH